MAERIFTEGFSSYVCFLDTTVTTHEGWLTAPHRMNPAHREPAGLSVPASAYT